MKRKIALVEGKRRALQSSFERENKDNRAKINELDEQLEVRDLGRHVHGHVHICDKDTNQALEVAGSTSGNLLKK